MPSGKGGHVPFQILNFQKNGIAYFGQVNDVFFQVSNRNHKFKTISS